jgi:hypothetical protein
LAVRHNPDSDRRTDDIRLTPTKRDCSARTLLPVLSRHMTRAIVIAALLACSPAVVHDEDRSTTSSDGRFGEFSYEPKDHSDCIDACALRLKEMQSGRTCTAACTSLQCPRK